MRELVRSLPADLAFAPIVFVRNLAVTAGCYLAALGYLAGAYDFGCSIRSWTGGSPAARPWSAAGWGLASMILVVLGLGLTGLLFRPVLWFLLGAHVLRGARMVAGRGIALPSWNTLSPGLWLLPVVPWLVAGPLLPPTNVDTLGGHLGLPALWLLAHKVTAFAGNPYYSYPLGFERAALPLYATLGTGSVNAFTVLLLAAAAGALATALKTGAPAYASWGGWLLFGCGPVLANAWEGHPDTGLVLASALGVLALLRGGAADLGLAAGLAVLGKYTGIPVAATLVLAGLLRAGRPARRVAAAALAAVICLGLNGPWLARNIEATGNPVYPFGAGWFPSLRWTAWNGSVLWGTMRDASVAWGWTFPEDGVRAYAALPWTAARSIWFAPHVLLLYLLPLLLVVRRTVILRGARVLAAQALLFAVLWAVPAPKFGRYLLPVVAPVLGGWLLSAGRSPIGRGTRAALGAILLLGGLGFVAQIRPAGTEPERVLFGGQTTEAFRRARLGVWCDTVDWINVHAPGGRVVVIGHVYGYGLNAPWLANDDASPPAFRLALGDDPDPGRLRIGCRQAGVRWILYNPIRSAHRKDWVRGNLTDAWLAGYAEFWRRWTDLVRPPDRFDDTGGWYLYAVRRGAAPPGGTRPRPWLPGAECLQQDELEILHGRVDRPRLAAQERIMGDFGIAWSQRALLSYRIDRMPERAIHEEQEAVRRGLDTPWACGMAGFMLWTSGRLAEAIPWERRVLALKPDMAESKAILDDITRRTRRGR